MTQDSPRFERFLEQAARVVSGAGLHPVAILQQVQGAAEAGIRDGAIPNRYRISVASQDSGRIRRLESSLRTSIHRMLEDTAARRGLTPIADWDISFEVGSVAPGSVRVAADYADPSHRESARTDLAARPTEVITRLSGVALVLEGGGRINITHAPFFIGRAAGCDLVLPDLSISRRHAAVRSDGQGLVLVDMESRNGITVNGARVPQLGLYDGLRFMLGDVEFAVEISE